MHRLVDHTADLAIEATGPDRAAALAEACLGMTCVLTGQTEGHAVARAGGELRELRFVIEAPDEPSLIVAVLSELLWLHESEDLLWVGGGIGIEVRPDGILRATATGNGVQHDPDRHGRGVEVKAVTYHGLQSGAHGEGWRIWVLLDI